MCKDLLLSDLVFNEGSFSLLLQCERVGKSVLHWMGLKGCNSATVLEDNLSTQKKHFFSFSQRK